MDITTLFGAIAASKNLRDLTASLGKRVPDEVREQVIALYDRVSDLQAAALSAQQRESELIERCRELEVELGRLNDWETESARYTLQDIGGMAFVYVQKPGIDAPDVPHWLCVNCFEDRRKSHLQAQRFDRRGDQRIWECPHCHAKTAVYWSRNPAAPEAVR